MNRQAPYLKVCPKCHLHGNIIFPDGSSSEDIILKEQGINIITKAFEKGKILGSEASILTLQVKKSNFFSGSMILDTIEKSLKSFEEANEKIKKIGCDKFMGNVMN